jgi:threonylcarbamoyladenosine tRNA methylthiotransferase MtaB
MKKAAKLAIYTLGCKLNQAESDALREEFERQGWESVSWRTPADLTVINTCTVTNQADAKCRNIIRQAVAASPAGKIAVIGCFAQVNAEAVKAIPGVDIILGVHEKSHLYQYFSELEEKSLIKLDQPLSQYEESTFISSSSRTRAFLKIQDGCDYHCRYCIIPQARGGALSRRFSSAIQEAQKLVQQGFKELVLTGINLGTYHDKGQNLLDILKALTKIEGLERLRISSVEINTIDDAMIHLIAENQKIMPHLHLPLQSGSDDTLQRMGRRYDTGLFREKIAALRAKIPDIGLGTDLIVGFPGETDAEFAATEAFIREIGFSYLHIFRYSKRKNTPAAEMPNQIDERVKKERAAEMKKLSQKLRSAFAEKMVNQRVAVLWEEENNGRLSGWTPNYLRIHAAGTEEHINKIKQTEIKSAKNGQLWGEIL